MATATKALPGYLTPLRETPSRPGVSGLLIASSDLAALILAIGVSLWLGRQSQGDYELTSYWRLWPILGVFISAYGFSDCIPELSPASFRRSGA